MGTNDSVVIMGKEVEKMNLKHKSNQLKKNPTVQHLHQVVWFLFWVSFLPDHKFKWNQQKKRIGI